MFKVGQKVVCIGTNFGIYPPSTKFPLKGEMYTIRGFETVNGRQCIFLEEIVNAPYHFIQGVCEAVFGLEFFRAIDYSYGEQVCESLEVMTEPQLV